MSVNPEDWDVVFAFPDFNLKLCLNENEADIETGEFVFTFSEPFVVCYCFREPIKTFFLDACQMIVTSRVLYLFPVP